MPNVLISELDQIAAVVSGDVFLVQPEAGPPANYCTASQIATYVVSNPPVSSLATSPALVGSDTFVITHASGGAAEQATMAQVAAFVGGQAWSEGVATPITSSGPVAFSLATGTDYMFSIQGVIPFTDGDALECQFSQTATYVTATNAYNDGAGSGAIVLISAMGNGAQEGCSAEVTLQAPGSDGIVKRIQSVGLRCDTSGNEGAVIGGGRFALNTDAIDGVRFQFPSGGFATQGQIVAYAREWA